MRNTILASAVFCVSACASQPKVAPSDTRLVDDLATQAASFIATQLPVASTPVLLESSASLDLTAATTTALLKRGFAVAVPGVETKGAKRVRVISTDANAADVLLRVTVENQTATRLYQRRADGGLQPASVFTVSNDEPSKPTASR